MIDQVTFVDNVSRVRRGRPARATTLQRVAASGLLLPIASVYALISAAALMLEMILGGYGYIDWFVPMLPLGAVKLLVTHPWTYVGAIACLGLGGLSRWMDPPPSHRTSRAAASALGIVVIVACLPAWWESVDLVYVCAGSIWFAEVVQAGLFRSRMWSEGGDG